MSSAQLQCTVDEFLGALQAAAEVNHCRAVIIIDAINEGPMARRWYDQIAGFLQKVRRWPRLGIVLSCRTGFLDDLVPATLDALKLIRIEHQGFAGHEYQAVRLFFDNLDLSNLTFPCSFPSFKPHCSSSCFAKGFGILG